MVRAFIRELANRRMTGLLAPREDASDLAQSVVLELMRDGAKLQFHGTAATKALAREILLRLVSDRVRAMRTQMRDSRREQRLPDGDDSQLAAPLAEAPAGANPAELAEVRELLAMAEQRLSLLSAREQEVMRRRAAGESHHDIAAGMGISAAYSQRLLSDARRKVRGA